MPDDIKISALTREYMADAAGIHVAMIPTGFLTLLGIRFLARLYACISNEPHSFVLGALDPRAAENGRAALLGFIAGTTDTQEMYRSVLKKRWPVFALLLAGRLFNVKNARRMIETVKYGLKSRENNGQTGKETTTCGAELLTIAVRQSSKRKGIGRNLVIALENAFMQKRAAGAGNQGKFCYKVVTLSTDPASNSFYRSCGFRLHRQFQHHGNTMNEYVKEPGAV